MSDDLIDYLHVQFARLDERFDRLESKVDDLIVRVGALDAAAASISACIWARNPREVTAEA